MKNKQRQTFFIVGIIALVVVRGYLNAYLPLMDKTEARYAEIARLMLETNDWITLQIDYGVPFWAKPPLSSWLSAFSMKLFGVNEFAVRLPSFITSLSLIFIIGKYIVRSLKAIFLISFVLLTLPEFFLHAGAVSTDIYLTFSITLVLLSFWKSIHGPDKSIWGYLIFVFLGIGLLAKGPIIVILTLPPIFIWVFLFKSFKLLIRKIPWLVGIFISLIIAAPWYYLAELQSNGFLDYFLLSEHFHRYFDESWQGDKYGSPAVQPLGTIWVYLFIFAFPWIQIAIAKAVTLRKQILQDKWVMFLLLWVLWTPIFFSISSSVLHTYILPAVIPIALLISNFWDEIRHKKIVILTGTIFPILLIITLGVSHFNNYLEYYSNTDKYLLPENVENLNSPLYYLGEKSYSSQFYSQGKIKNIYYPAVQNKMKINERFHIIIRDRAQKKFNISNFDSLLVVKENYKKKLYRFPIERATQNTSK